MPDDDDSRITTLPDAYTRDSSGYGWRERLGLVIPSIRLIAAQDWPGRAGHGQQPGPILDGDPRLGVGVELPDWNRCSG
jgi:hypothetical protein